MLDLLLAWVWAPLALYVVVLGIGLLADAVTRADLPAALIPGVGFGVTVILATLGFKVAATPAVTVVLLVAAAAGFVLARRHLRERCWSPYALTAGGLVYMLYMAPVFASGEATWAGYNFVNDTAANFIITNALEQSGTTLPTEQSGNGRIAAAFLGFGYPLGSFSVLAGVRPLAGAPVEAIYQPVLSVMAALGAMSLTDLARRAGLRPVSTVVGGTLPMGGVLLYRYVLHGSIKEVALVALCLAAAAVAMLAIERRLPVRVIVILAVLAAAMVLVFSFAAAAYVGALAAAMLVAAFLSPDRPSLRHVARLAGVAALLGVVALIPVLGSALDFADTIRTVFADSGGDPTAQFGQLVRGLPATEAAGVWFSRDYRYPADGAYNAEAVAAMLVVFAAGIGVAVWRRRLAPLVLLAMVGLPALALAPASSVYIDGKLLMVLTPAAVFVAAFAALSGIEAGRRPVRILGAVALLVVAGGVLWSDVYSYRETRPAPIDRVEAMKDAAAHAPGEGLYLFNEWEEYGKFFLRGARVNPASESQAPDPVELRRDAPIFGRWFDLDRQKLAYVEGFAGVIMRRSPAASRPPANFRRLYRNDYYEVWRKTDGPRVREHLPLQSADRAVAVPDCAKVRALARQARPGDRLLAAERPRVARLSPLIAPVRPPGWPPSGEAKGTLTTRGPGAVRGSVTASGTQRVYVRASALRKLTVLVDGRKVGSVGEMNTPDQWIDVGTVRLGGGRHRIEVRRGSRTWRPGDSYYGNLGPVALQAQGRPRLVPVAPRDADGLCGRPWDWIELVSGRS